MKATAATSTPAKMATPPSSGVSRRDRPRSRGDGWRAAGRGHGAACGRPRLSADAPRERRVRIWIDLTAPAHPVVFRPIVARLRDAGHDVEVTARDYAQTLPLARRLGIEHHAVGAHGGSRRANKLARLAERSAALWRWARPRRFDLAVAHGSNDLAVVAGLLRVPAVDMFDYEWATLQHTVGCRPARRGITPDAIPPQRLRRHGVTH